MLGLALKIAIMATMKNHVYMFNNKFYQQGRKAIIGLDLMRALAKLYMIDWSMKFMKRLKEVEEKSSDLKLNLKPELYKVFVDDQSSLQEATPMGATYNKKTKRITITEKQKELDKDLKADRRTANLLTEIANTIDPSILMESVVPSDSESGKMPLLDCQIWLENIGGVQQIRHEHYEKAMSSKVTIQKESAMPEKIRRATLVQGGITRILNTSRELPDHHNSSARTDTMSVRALE